MLPHPASEQETHQAQRGLEYGEFVLDLVTEPEVMFEVVRFVGKGLHWVAEMVIEGGCAGLECLGELLVGLLSG